uniref:TrwC relaxase domain-containing protein n=1 Tax=Streptomyces rochei TaxID=1928 RepID=F2Z8V7_STRRO|nr:hypothetical protein [Streptomyces rochei]
MKRSVKPQPTIYLLSALGDEETRRMIEAAHEYAIERVLEWIEGEAAVIRYGKDGIYWVRLPDGLVAARFRRCDPRVACVLEVPNLSPPTADFPRRRAWRAAHDGASVPFPQPTV